MYLRCTQPAILRRNESTPDIRIISIKDHVPTLRIHPLYGSECVRGSLVAVFYLGRCSSPSESYGTILYDYSYPRHKNNAGLRISTVPTAVKESSYLSPWSSPVPLEGHIPSIEVTTPVSVAQVIPVLPHSEVPLVESRFVFCVYQRG